MRDQASGGSIAIPSVRELSLDQALVRLGVGALTMSPTNDGRTDDDAAFTLLELNLQPRFEFRYGGRLLAPWLELDGSFFFGERSEERAGAETGVTMGVLGMRAGGLFGLDFHPIDMIGVGPALGYGLSFYELSVENESGTVLNEDDALELDHGIQYGLHSRFRTREAPGDPATFYLDGRIIRRHGAYQQTFYGGLEAGVRVGGSYLVAWFESRLGSSGSFTYRSQTVQSADAETLTAAFAASAPISQRLGAGVVF